MSEQENPLNELLADGNEGEAERERARNDDGTYKGDDPSTPDVDEAWVDGKPDEEVISAPPGGGHPLGGHPLGGEPVGGELDNGTLVQSDESSDEPPALEDEHPGPASEEPPETQTLVPNPEPEEVTDHASMVRVLAKPGAQICKEMTPLNWTVLGQAVRDMVAAGNKLDAAKKQTIYNKPPTLMPVPTATVPPLTAEQCHLLHMAVGIAGEAAELLEAVMAHCMGAPLDYENLEEEMGDIEFYMEGARQGAGLSRHDTLVSNMDKLSERYNGFRYSDTAAIERADKS